MAYAILRKNFHFRQVLTTIHGKVVSSKVSTFHSFFGRREVGRPHPWLSSLSRERVIQRMNVHLEISPSEAKQPIEERRRSLNRILYRSRQRGHLELDLVLGRWTEENLENLDDKKLKSLMELLDVENPELWKWLTGQDETPEHLTKNPVFMEIHGKIMGALSAHSPSETRAKLGQPWVRGWDDNRKIGGPQVGNQ